MAKPIGSIHLIDWDSPRPIAPDRVARRAKTCANQDAGRSSDQRTDRGDDIAALHIADLHFQTVEMHIGRNAERPWSINTKPPSKYISGSASVTVPRPVRQPQCRGGGNINTEMGAARLAIIKTLTAINAGNTATDRPDKTFRKTVLFAGNGAGFFLQLSLRNNARPGLIGQGHHGRR